MQLQLKPTLKLQLDGPARRSVVRETFLSHPFLSNLATRRRLCYEYGTSSCFLLTWLPFLLFLALPALFSFFFSSFLFAIFLILLLLLLTLSSCSLLKYTKYYTSFQASGSRHEGQEYQVRLVAEITAICFQSIAVPDLKTMRLIHLFLRLLFDLKACFPC